MLKFDNIKINSDGKLLMCFTGKGLIFYVELDVPQWEIKIKEAKYYNWQEQVDELEKAKKEYDDYMYWQERSRNDSTLR